MNGPRLRLPYFTCGKVVKGFGRGSKDLGCPTANFPDEVVAELPAEFECGVYYGWASVDNGEVHEMCMSVGWNPFYNNTKRTMETHILHEFEEDFYGSILKICVTGHLRPMLDFKSLDELIAAIQGDIKATRENLANPEQQLLKLDKFFTDKS